MNDAPVDVGIAFTDSGESAQADQGRALYRCWGDGLSGPYWNKRFSSSIGYSMLNISNSDGPGARRFPSRSLCARVISCFIP